jgi:trigger factor
MPVEEVRKYFGNRNDLLPFMNELLNEKVLEFLRENTVIKEVEVEEQTEEADTPGEDA